MQQAIFGVGVRELPEEVVLLLVYDFVIVRVLQGHCVDGCVDGGAVSIGDWIGGGFLLRSRDGSDLGRCCGGRTTAKGGR